MGIRTEAFISARPGQDFLDLFDNEQAELALTTSVASTVSLDHGFYDVWIDSGRAYIGVDDAAIAGLTTANGYPIFSGNMVTLYIREGHIISAILASGTTTLRYHKVDG